jgi:RNA polymerase sigma-70 factor (ECF subfamily)
MKATPVNEDKILVLQLQNNSVNAFDSLFYKYSDNLYGFAFSLLKNREDSKEIVQEAFCRVWDRRNELDSSKSFKSFLFTISYNLIVDQLRIRLKNKEYRKFLEEYFNSVEVFNENKADYKIISGKVRSAVEEFPKKRKEVYILSREKGLSQKEIANQLGISVKTVENHINLSLKHLRLRLGKDIIS